jgi:lipopolysaccharide export system protein LptA
MALYKSISPLAFLCLCSSPLFLHAAESGDLLTGSVVKSEKWKMDRANSLEIFDGNVSLINAVYDLKADNAVYDRKARTWTLRGSVYCLRKFLDGSNLELYCQDGKYFEDIEKAEVYRGAVPVRMKYLSNDGRPLKGLCDRIIADNAKASMDFIGNFYLQTQQMDIFSDNGFYSDTDRSFLIYNSIPDSSIAKAALKSAPVAVGTREGRDFALTGEKMKFFKDTGDVKLYNKVAGWIKAEESAPDTKRQQPVPKI